MQHAQLCSGARGSVAATVLAGALVLTLAAGPAHASVLKKCPSGSSLSSAAGTTVKLHNHSKLNGQLVCGYTAHGSPLAVLTVETIGTAGQSPSAYLKSLESSAKSQHYKVKLLHGLGSSAFEGTLKGSITNVYALVSGQIVHVGSLAVAPAHVVAVARSVVG